MRRKKKVYYLDLTPKERGEKRGGRSTTILAIGAKGEGKKNGYPEGTGEGPEPPAGKRLRDDPRKKK